MQSIYCGEVMYGNLNVNFLCLFHKEITLPPHYIINFVVIDHDAAVQQHDIETRPRRIIT